ISLLLSLTWFLNTSQACPCGKRDNHHNATIIDRNQTFWRRVRTGTGGGSSALPTISDLFTVGDGSTPGGCSDRKTLIDGWIEDALLLHDAVETAYDSFKSNRCLMLLWVQFFGIKFNNVAGTVDTDDDVTEILWQSIGKRISSVSQFLAGAGLVGSVAPGNPWMFCSEAAGEYTPFDQPIKDEDGSNIAKTVDQNGNPDLLTLREVFPVQASDPRIEAFYIEAFKGYDMDTNGYDTLCGKPSLYAVTARPLPNNIVEEHVDVVRYNRHILFCPPTFSPGTGHPHSYPSLSQAVSSDHYPGDKTGLMLDQYVPVSATFYHELWHLADPTGITNDPYCKCFSLLPYYSLSAVLNAGSRQKGDTYRNPESFVFFAMAAYMYLHPPEGKDAVLFVAGKP
ncbi:hypothetical protein P280DRAFT_361918, partial [Massarina eburnea CBS 473.64]